MMHHLILLFIVTFLAQSDLVSGSGTKLNHPKFQCEIICSRAGGKSDFDNITKNCKCTLDKGVDGTDIDLLNKYAKVLGLKPNSIEPLNHSTLMIKRDTAQAEADLVAEEAPAADPAPTTAPPSSTPAEAAEATSAAPAKAEPEPVVGQAAPGRRAGRLPARRTPPARTITPEQQRLILAQIRDHATRLGTATDQRLRQLEIDALHASLRQLSESSLAPVPAVRSRLRIAAEEARKRALTPRINARARIVGAEAPAEAAKNAERVESSKSDAVSAVKAIRKIHPRFEVITQDPSLVDN